MIPLPLFKKLFDKFNASSTRTNSPNNKATTRIKGNGNKVSNNFYSNRTHNASNITEPKTANIVHSSIAPRAILDDIDSHTPYLRKSAEEAYVGTSVKWKLTFHHIDEFKPNQAHLIFLVKNTYPWVYAEVLFSDYPQIKRLNEKDEIYVSGKIKEAHGNTITLEDSKLEFIKD